MEVLSNFASASHTKWFSQALETIEVYIDNNGICRYPIKYLTEKILAGYWEII